MRVGKKIYTNQPPRAPAKPENAIRFLSPGPGLFCDKFNYDLFLTLKNYYQKIKINII